MHSRTSKSRRTFRPLWLLPVLLLALPVLMGPGRCGVSAEGFFSDKPAPDMRGEWAVTYDDSLGIEIDLGGGAIYEGTVSATGGQFAFTHDGEQVTLDLDCSLDWIVCPSEVWTPTVEFDQPNFATRPHQVEMSIHTTECSNPRPPVLADGECSEDPAENMPCDEDICDEADVVETTAKRIASISNPVPPEPDLGSTPAYTMGVALGGGYAVPFANCLLLAASFADADLEYDGTYDPAENTMTGTDLSNGLVTVDFHGACFWGTYQGGTLKAALLGARVRLTTGFTASAQ